MNFALLLIEENYNFRNNFPRIFIIRKAYLCLFSYLEFEFGGGGGSNVNSLQNK